MGFNSGFKGLIHVHGLHPHRNLDVAMTTKLASLVRRA